jgi:hypothetical protein
MGIKNNLTDNFTSIAHKMEKDAAQSHIVLPNDIGGYV